VDARSRGLLYVVTCMWSTVQGKSLLLELSEDTLELLDPHNYCLLTLQPIRLIRLWAVSRNDDRLHPYHLRLSPYYSELETIG